MFWEASAFNQDISNWDVSSGIHVVSGLGLLWETCSSCYCFLYYSSSSSEWTKQTKALHTSSFFNNLTTPIIVNNNGAPLLLLSQRWMFAGATTFNQDISTWNVDSGQDFVSGLGLLWESCSFCVLISAHFLCCCYRWWVTVLFMHSVL